MAVFDSQEQLHEFINASPSAKTPKSPTKEEGTVYISSAGQYYSQPKIDANKILDLHDNIYARGVLLKLLNLVFQDMYSIEVIESASKKVDTNLSNTLMDMCETADVALWDAMQQTYADWYWWGISMYNPVWGTDPNIGKNENRLLKLRHLPGETFKTSPPGVIYVYSQILSGIVLNDKNQMEFWQEPHAYMMPVQIKNAFYARKPTDRGLAGDPMIVPMIPIIEMLKFTLNASMQQVNRIGSKILFIKVTNPQAASTRNGNISDVDYANNIIQNWGKDTAYQVRENMELIDLKLADDSNNLQVIDMLGNMIIEYVAPGTFISNKQETRLGGNDSAQKEILDNFIKGEHRKIENQFEALLQQYLDYNGFKGYQVNIKIPDPSHSTRSEDRLDAQTGFLAQCLTINERRKKLKEPPLSDADVQKLQAEYAQITKVPQLVTPVRQ